MKSLDFNPVDSIPDTGKNEYGLGLEMISFDVQISINSAKIELNLIEISACN